jgi:hypothetical protein
MAIRTSALERMAPEYPPEVLAQKARDIAGRLGYAARPVDSEFGFWWDPDLAGYISRNDKPSPRWSEILRGRPSLLHFWYRQSDELMTSVMYHDDVLTPGVVRPDDPPPVRSGMVAIDLDHAGRLTEFQAIPPQKLEPLQEGMALAAADWKPLFESAGFDAGTLQPVEPLWTFLGASDTRVAWTGTWPGTSRPVRVEAAALRGKPVAFSVIGPWTTPSREPERSDSSGRRLSDMVYGIIAAIICVGAAVLARRNLGTGRGDRRGAFKLAAFTFTMHMAVWLFRSHITVSVSLLGLFFLALCTSLFYGLLIWTVYLALEPYARRHWPRTLIAWTRVLTGQIRDPLVGRDALVGAGLGVSWVLIGRVYDLLFQASSDLSPTWTDPELLRGLRAATAEWLTRGPRSVLYALLFFFLLFLLRLLLRNQWLGAAAFVVVLTIPQVLKVDRIWLQASASVIVYALMALVVLRFGLLSLAVAFFVSGMIGPPPTLHTSAWYFFNIMVGQLAAVGVAIWAFWLSVGQRSLWRFEA